MSSQGLVRKMKPIPWTMRVASLSSNGRLTHRKVKVSRKRRKKRKATFLQLFGGLLYEDCGPDAPALPVPQPQAQSTTSVNKTYNEKRKAYHEAWSQQRQQLLMAFVDDQHLDPSTICSEDGCTTTATCRCSDCGNSSFFCDNHAVKVHQKKLHVPCFWKVANTRSHSSSAIAIHSCNNLLP